MPASLIGESVLTLFCWTEILHKFKLCRVVRCRDITTDAIKADLKISSLTKQCLGACAKEFILGE